MSGCATFLAQCLRGQLRVDFDWEALYSDAAGQAVLPSLACASRGLALPVAVREFLTAVEASNRERNELIAGELKVAVGLLNAVGITPVLLKGVAYQAVGLYGDFGARYIQDIDLLLAEDELRAGSAVLAENGFAADVLDPFGGFRHHLPPLRRASRVCVELHGKLGGGECERVLPSREVIAGSVVWDVDGVKFRVPCPEHLALHLVLHSQVVHPYEERIWPPVRAMWDLVMLERKYGVDWSRVVARFPDTELHLMQVRESLGVDLTTGNASRLRWARRQVLRRWPALRYVDPLYMFATLFRRRLRMLRNVLGSRGGFRYLMGQAFNPGHYGRLWTDLREGRGR